MATTAVATPHTEFFAMDTIARGEPVAVARMLRELGYDGIGGGLDAEMPAAINREGLRFFNGYHVITLSASGDIPEAKLDDWINSRKDSNATLWLAIERVLGEDGKSIPFSSPRSWTIATDKVEALAKFAELRGVKISLYPHTGYWLERFSDTLRFVESLSSRNVSLTFNLCHWLKVEGDQADPLPLIRDALPHLTFITINGADSGDTRQFGWDRLIQPLDAGSYDVARFVRRTRSLGYSGPFGVQGYGIKGEPRDVLARTMSAWQHILAGPSTTDFPSKN